MRSTAQAINPAYILRKRTGEARRYLLTPTVFRSLVNLSEIYPRGAKHCRFEPKTKPDTVPNRLKFSFISYFLTLKK